MAGLVQDDVRRGHDQQGQPAMQQMTHEAFKQVLHTQLKNTGVLGSVKVARSCHLTVLNAGSRH